MVWRVFARNRRGNVATLFAAGMAVSGVVAAFAVDAGSLYYERRALQSAVDLAAIEAARDPENGPAIARAVLIQAGVLAQSVTIEDLADPESASRLRVEAGRYQADPDIGPNERFVAGPASVNAVRVSARKPGRLYFASSWSPVPVMSAEATATVTPRVAFSIGSRLAALQGGIANAVLNKLLGTTIALSAVDYNGLLDARVGVLAYLDALAFELGITAGTYDDVLNATASNRDLVKALASVLSGAEATAAGLIAGAIDDDGRVPVGKLLDLGDLGALSIGSSGQDIFAEISALDLLAASAVLGEGGKQIALALSVGLPGVVGIGVDMAVGEPPQFAAWYAVGPTGTVTRAAQIRLRIVADLLGSSSLLNAGVRLPLYLEVAHAEAVASAATCPSETAPFGSATILARPGIARLMVGEVPNAGFGDFGTLPAVGKATLINALLLRVLGSALVEVAQTDPVALDFSSAEIAARTVKTAATETILASLVGSLLSTLDIEVPVLGIPLVSTKLVGQILAGLLAPVTPVLDAILAGLLDALGLSLGQADVRVYGVTCGHPVLVG